MATTKTTALPSPGSAPPRNNKGNRRMIIFMLVQLLLVAGVSVGATWAIMNRLRVQVEREATAVAVAAAQVGATVSPEGTAALGSAPIAIPIPDSIPEPIFYELAPFTVTVENDVSERILHVGLTLRLADDASRERLERYLPEVRNRVLLELSHLTPDSLKGAQGRTELASAIITTLNRPFAPLPVGQYVTDVLFTTFVVQ